MNILGPLQFGIIGCQHAHITMFIREMIDLGHKCVGIYEAENKELLTQVAKQFDLPIVEEVDVLLGPDVDVIGCAEVNHKKIDVIERCEAHGKPIMVDKPLVTSRDALERVEQIIERGNIEIGMLLTERFRPSIYTLKKRIDEGDIGEIVSIEMRKPHHLRASERPSWHFSKEKGGGIIVDLLIHDFDLLHWLTGKDVAEMTGYVTKNILPEHETFYDVVNLQVLLEDGILCNLYADWHTPDQSWTWGDCRIFITGTKGTYELRLSGDPLVTKDELMIRITHEEPIQKVSYEKAPRTITEDFLARIKGKEALIQHEDILKATRNTFEADEIATYINHVKE